MNITDIIKESFVFPSKNLKALAIFIILSIIAGAFTAFGAFSSLIGILDSESFLVGGLCLIVAGLIGLVMAGYEVRLIKSGIESEEEAPEFEWWENFNTGFDNLIVTVVYFLIPTIIIFFVAIAANVFGNIDLLIQEIIYQTGDIAIFGASTSPAFDAVTQAFINLIGSLAITMVVSLVLYVIFSFLQTMAQARLANTGSLSEALDILEAAKDIKRIGIGKVIALVILIILVIAVVNFILTIIPILALLSFIITPYLLFFTQRAIGLLYADIA